MHRRTNPNRKRMRYLAAFCLLLVFIVDIVTPANFAIDILYLCCILMVFKESPKIIIWFSGSACLLITAAVLIFDLLSEVSLPELINHGISIIAIAITCYITVFYKKEQTASLAREERYVQDLEEMLFLTSHHLRKPVANILGLTEIVLAGVSRLSPAELQEICGDLHISGQELDGFVKELNEFIRKSEDSFTIDGNGRASNG